MDCMRTFLAAFLLFTVSTFALTNAELDSIGGRVWQNECGGTREGLTSWNAGENFASLGIGHFIWYPRGVEGPFEESFPKLVRFLAAKGKSVPEWMNGDCPWTTRAAFEADRQSARMKELRDLLASTVRLQSHFLAERMHKALPKMVSAAPAGQRANVKAQFERLAATGPGTFALIDYVNFKGEGTKESERYNGEGWGLLQVLAGMNGSGRGAAREFGESATRVLTRRVQNAPPARGEGRWLAGWKSRVRAYGE
jgi:hypothetical protein